MNELSNYILGNLRRNESAVRMLARDMRAQKRFNTIAAFAAVGLAARVLMLDLKLMLTRAELRRLKKADGASGEEKSEGE